MRGLKVQAHGQRARGHARTVKVAKVDSAANRDKVVRTRKAHPVVQVVQVPLVVAATAAVAVVAHSQ